MFPRCSFALCALVFFTVVCGTQAAVNAEDVEIGSADVKDDDDDVDECNPLLAIAIGVIGKAKWTWKQCLKDAAMNCKRHWKHPKDLVNCAKTYFKANKNRCVIG